jgi:oxygen-independent coproporphyrinogen-3 oxidase
MFGIYIHIPFCIRRCPFCDFTLVTGAPEKLIDSYVHALCMEIEKSKTSHSLTSIYLGGGTPSILSIRNLGTIFTALKKNFDQNSDIEITLETNPEDVTSERVQQWKELGINRLSLGVQSMDDEQLKRLGRNHNEHQVFEAFKIFKSENFQNISADLMFGLENQTLDSWKLTLNKIIALKPLHISTYNLMIEKNTSYDKEFSKGSLTVPSDELQADMLVAEKNILEKNGFDPYEISNAAIPGFESRHNMLYWTGKSYLGFGVSAHSFQNENKTYRRFWNTKNIPIYIKNIDAQKSVIESEEVLDPPTHLTERLMTGLRLKTGIDLDVLKKEGLSMSDAMKKNLHSLVQDGFLHQTQSIISIPTKHIPITNEILLRLFSN